MILAIIITGSTLSACSLCLFFLLDSRNNFYRLCRAFLVFILIHFLHVLVCELFFNSPDKRYIDWAAPYALLYGPFLFAAQHTDRGRLKNRAGLLLQILPFLIFSVLYILLICLPKYRHVYLRDHKIWLFRVIKVSFLVYAFFVIFQGTKVRRLLSLFAIILATLSLIFISAAQVSSPGLGPYRFLWSRIVIYLVMTGVVVVLFRHGLLTISQHIAQKRKGEIPRQTAENGEPAYQKSILPEDVMERYYERLKDAMETDQAFLDQELSLEGLASKLKMPRHHLTQLLSVYLDTNFYQFVNTYRVNYACDLIKSGGEVKSLEDIGLQSGFNSKTSFNRYFRNQTGCTPSEFRKRHKGS